MSVAVHGLTLDFGSRSPLANGGGCALHRDVILAREDAHGRVGARAGAYRPDCHQTQQIGV